MTNDSLLKLLRRNGRSSDADLAERASLSEDAVERNVFRLYRIEAWIVSSQDAPNLLKVQSVIVRPLRRNCVNSFKDIQSAIEQRQREIMRKQQEIENL